MRTRPHAAPATFLLVSIVAFAAMVPRVAAQEVERNGATTRPAAANGVDVTKEPLQEFVLEVDGKRTEVTAERSFQIDVAGKSVDARLTPKPDRPFTTGDLSFRYPSDFAFEYDPSEDVPSWEFDGTDTVITVLRYDPESKPDELVDSVVEAMTDTFNRRSAKTKPTSLRLDGRNVDGKRLTSRLADTRLQHDVYGFTVGGHPYVLIIQDTLSEGGKPSAETVEAVELLKKTFRFDSNPSTAPAAAR